MNRTEERKIIATIGDLGKLICNNYVWCSDCPLHISTGDTIVHRCSMLVLKRTFEKNDGQEG